MRHNGFILFDDPAYITRNPQVTGGLSRDGLVWAFTGTASDNWHPLTWISHMLDVTLFGMNPAAHHLESLLLHAVNAVLLFLVLAALTGRRWPSALAAALFAIHPLHVESVAWASERKGRARRPLLDARIGAHLRYARRPGLARYAATALCSRSGCSPSRCGHPALRPAAAGLVAARAAGGGPHRPRPPRRAGIAAGRGLRRRKAPSFRARRRGWRHHPSRRSARREP